MAKLKHTWKLRRGPPKPKIVLFAPNWIHPISFFIDFLKNGVDSYSEHSAAPSAIAGYSQNGLAFSLSRQNMVKDFNSKRLVVLPEQMKSETVTLALEKTRSGLEDIAVG